MGSNNHSNNNMNTPYLGGNNPPLPQAVPPEAAQLAASLAFNPDTTSSNTNSFYQDSLTSSTSSSLIPTNCHRPRRPIIAGNWKLNPTTLQEAKTMFKLLSSNFIHHNERSNDVEVVIFPPFPFLSTAIDELEGTGIKVGAQNVGTQIKGAYTGEVGPSMLSSLGCSYIMVGHSERRTLFSETDNDINQKIQLCLVEEGNIGGSVGSGLNIILCVGETLEEYENDLLESVVDVQIKKALMGVSAKDVLERIVIAYEPVWAIGTGKVATPDQAQIAHVAIRKTLEGMYNMNVAQNVRIQYGGSVSPDSIESLMKMPDIDGALVGGASLIPDSFTRIVDGGVIGNELLFGMKPQEYVAKECVATRNVLGESPVWSVRDQALYWISAPEEEVWMWNMKDPPFRRQFGTTIGCVALRQGEEGSIVVAGEQAFLKTTMKSGHMADFGTGAEILAERPEQSFATRPNDGRVDRQGRLVFGMYNNYHRAGVSAGENICGLYRLNSNLDGEQIMDYRYRVSNCICFFENQMYFCDTPTRKVYAFDYPESGPVTNRRLIWTMPSNLPGGPDGAQVDERGGLWMALSGAGRVVRVDPTTGSITHTVHLPVKSPTSVSEKNLHPNFNQLFDAT